ncbi:MAG: outer membrane protein assembly factor BamD [Lentisphaeria bacterium]|nr:outer membrane protein assembly factor BamD [Lentisphaeria bacterium]
MQIRKGLVLAVLFIPCCYLLADEWVKEDAWNHKGWFSSINYLEAAEESHADQAYEDAADYYEKVFETSILAPNKAKALFEKGRNFELAGMPYSAFESYRELVTRYSNAAYYDSALVRIVEIGDAFEKAKSTLFSNNYEKAIEVYTTILTLAPYSKHAPLVALKAARLHAGGTGRPKAIRLYRRIIKEYKNSQNEVEISYLNLGKILESKSRRSDGDVEVAKQGQDLMMTFMVKYPESQFFEEGKALKTIFDNRVAMYDYKIGLFYTWDAHKNKSVARRYLYAVLLNYPDSPAAVEAEKLLSLIDVNYKATEIEMVARQQDPMELPLDEKFVPSRTALEKAKDPSTWEPETFRINHPERTDKWLTPVPSAKKKGVEDEKKK